jgi:hypothetical protein
VAESTWTLPTHATMLTGVGSLVHRVDQFVGSRLDEEFTTLAERFRDAGYLTWGIYSGAYLHPVFGFGRGFDHYEGVIGETALDREFDLLGRTGPSHHEPTEAHRMVTGRGFEKRLIFSPSAETGRFFCSCITSTSTMTTFLRRSSGSDSTPITGEVSEPRTTGGTQPSTRIWIRGI